ncbi:MAG: hypothetical protein ACI4RD_11085 [Kiritimatiellia bacterium]
MKRLPSSVVRLAPFLSLLSVLSLSPLPSLAVGEDADSGCGYVGLSGAVLLPPGGSRLRCVAGAALRGGWLLTEDWAVEGEAAWLENVAGLSVGALGYLQGWRLYGDLFGYSRFDPFVTVGVRGWLGDGCGQVGPKAGLGAFFHLTDEWSLRADVDVTLGLETDCEAIGSVAVGVQRSF